MVPVRAASHPIRFAWATIFALLLAVRLLAPAGFMPAFDHGSVTIIACPDADPAVPAMHHHHHPLGHSVLHHPCPYASASGVGSLGHDWAALHRFALFATALSVGGAFLFIELRRDGERPFAIGPPIPA